MAGFDTFTDAVSLAWDDISGKPESYPTTWEQVQNKPDTSGGSGGGCSCDPDKGVFSTGVTVGTANTITTVYPFMVVGSNNASAGGYSSLIVGDRNTNDGSCAAVFGVGNRGSAHALGVGHFNDEKTINAASSDGTEGTAFYIGNGEERGRVIGSNAARLEFNGDLFLAGSLSDGGADYAEAFEALDDPENIGYFLTLEGDKYRKATSEDTWLIGIGSARPAMIGNDPERWAGKWLEDDFGRPVLDDEGYPVLNPAYEDKQYVARSAREEWGIIGMIGRLRVYDDGTCSVNGYCIPDDDGKATKAETGYRVIKRISPEVIEIIFTSGFIPKF